MGQVILNIASYGGDVNSHKNQGSGETQILDEMRRMPGFSDKFNPEV
jgi:hypothetical protein